MKIPKVSVIVVCSLLLASIVAAVSLFISSFGADPLEPRLREGASADSQQAASASAPSQAANSSSGPATAAQQAASVAATTTKSVSSLAATGDLSPASATSSVNTPSSARPATPSQMAARGAPRGSSASAFARQQQAVAASASLPLEPPPVPVAEILEGVDFSDPAQRALVVAQMEALGEARRDALLAKALALKVPVRIEKEGGGLSELFAFRGDLPLYRTTLNVNAAISSAAHLIRQTAPYDLNGAGLKIGVWDGGSVRATHQEFGTRVTKQDPTAANDDHGTHVAGTIAASGVDARAKGMAPLVNVDSYDWFDDLTEMTAAGAATGADTAKIPLSNHSYGYNGTLADQGRYNSIARDTDSVAYGLPYYLQFWAAGNEQRLFPNYGGFHTISFGQLAKNIVTVGAVNDAVTAGQRDPAKGTMSTFSSWGPCDDGRIKPDLVANGVTLYSTVASGDTAYEQAAWSGTSMASPSAMGSAALLAELYKREFAGQFPRASLLKALLVHTADDLGNAGPDYKYGWGLIDVKDAADLILAHKADPVLRPKFYEGQVSNAAKTQTYNFTWDGVTPIKATLCWNDPAGAAQTGVDSRTPNLVNNLDLRITAPDGATVYQPFVMPFVGTWTQASMNAPAIKGDNNTDNVEQVAAGLTGQLGTYTMTVTVDGSLTTATQDFSLVLTGAGEPVNPPPVVDIVSPEDGARLSPEEPITILVEATDVTAEQKPGTVSSVSLFVNSVLLQTLNSAPYEFTFAPPSVGVYTFKAEAVDSDGAVGFDTATLTFAYPPPGTVREDFYPPEANDHVQALAADPQGRIYVGGRFTTLDGGAAPRVGRLRPDGSVDPSFFVGAGPDAQVRALLHVPQDKGLYVGGHFANVAGTARRALVRLRTGQTGFVDGSLDPDFDPAIEGANSSSTPHVVALARQSDGKILVGGFFAKVNGVSRSNLARLNPDGTLDTSFAPNPTGAVHCVAFQPDGKILIGGAFIQVAGQTSRRIARLNRDGTLDTTFVTGTSVTGGFNGAVNSIAVTLDGEVIAGGQFTSYNGRAFYNNMAKLLPNGAVDGKFNFTPGVNSVVNDLHLRSTGEILVSGLFTQIANNVLGVAATPVGRVFQIMSGGTANGTIDPGFNPSGAGADGSVLDSITLPNGDILLGGAFASFNGEPRARLAVIVGFEQSTPVIVSQLFHNTDAGADLAFPFLASGDGPYFYQVIGALPRGVSFDSSTGSLIGVPLDAGRYDLQIMATSTKGSSRSTRFVLNVNDKKVPYAQWKKVWFPSPSDQTNNAVSGPSAVISNTAGLNNFLVYALNGGSPATADRSLVPVIRREIANGKTYLTLTASKYPGAGVNYLVQVSGDLATWGSSEPANVVTISNNATSLKVRAATPVTETKSQFLRLQVFAP